ncbi:MAG: response regulator transcription factor [Flavobacteriaceae bacterium]
MKKTVVVFGSLIIALMILFQLSKYSVANGDFALEFILVVIAICFFVVGFYFYKKLYPKEAIKEKIIDYQKIKSLEITDREYQVLEHISLGLSNKEIGERLFLSESTIKTHVSNLLLKLNAKRRTQALQKAKEMNIIL